MKKSLLWGILSLLFLLTISLFLIFNNTDEDSDLRVIRVAEVAHSIFYAPFYVAIENGYFADVNIEIDLILTPGANNVTAAVLSGDVQIGFCGPEASIYLFNEGVRDQVITFAGLTKRDGQFIVSRRPIENFQMSDLEGRTVIAGRAGGMPIINFITAINNTGVRNVIIDDTVDFANLASAFLAGNGDFVNLFEPAATRLENEGLGFVVGSIGMYAGEVPYTAFNARRSFIEANPDLINDFRTAINRGLDFVHNNDAEAIAKAIQPQFIDTSLADLIIIVQRHIDADSWLRTTYISEASFNNLEDMMMEAGLLNARVPFQELVDNG